jgi:hypothetical protein
VKLVDRHPLIEEILDASRARLGDAFLGYRGHVYRTFNFCRYLSAESPDRDDKIAIAAAFHDLTAFPDGDLDYLESSAAAAKEHLEASGRRDWIPEIELTILLHHKIRSYRDAHAELVEPFRRADWIEVSYGALRFGVPAALVAEARATFPMAGLYTTVLRAMGSWAIRHPTNPAPILRW